MLLKVTFERTSVPTGYVTIGTQAGGTTVTGVVNIGDVILVLTYGNGGITGYSGVTRFATPGIGYLKSQFFVATSTNISISSSVIFHVFKLKY